MGRGKRELILPSLTVTGMYDIHVTVNSRAGNQAAV